MLKKKTDVLTLHFQLHFHDRKGIWVAFTKKRKKKKKAVLFVNGDCNGTIDMHFILIVYKYKYIMNKIPIS